MSEPIFKSKTDENEVTLRAADESAAEKSLVSSAENAPAEKPTANEEASISAASHFAASQNQTSNEAPKASDPEDLLDVITDPHAGEQDWMSACNELERHNRRKERQEYLARQDRGKGRNKTIAIVAAAILAIFATSFGLFSYVHMSQSSTKSVRNEKNVDFGPYMAKLNREIKSHWHPPKSDVSKRIRVHFKVSKNGEISDIGFDRLSRDAEADAAALKSVIESMPSVPPLPEGAPESVDINFSFDYELSKGAGKKSD